MSKKKPSHSSGAPNRRESDSGAASRREQLRAQQAKAAREKKIRTWVTAGIVAVVAIALVGAAAWGIVRATRQQAPVAEGAATADYALTVGEADAPVTVDIYQDYMCPYCGQFERANRDDLEALVADGTAKVNFHLMNFLDSTSQGSRYSTRAANALVTVAKAEPEHVMALNAALYDNQPSEGTRGLTDDQIADLARQAGVSETVVATFADQTNAGFVNESNNAAGAAGVDSTPTIKINGQDFAGQQIYATGALRSAVEDAAGK